MHRVAPWVAIAFAASLCGCSAAPTDGDIKAALQDEQKHEKAYREADTTTIGIAMARPKADRLPFEIVSVRSRGCQAEGEKTYRCDVDMEIRQDNHTIKGTVVSLRLVKGQEGWSAQR